MPIFLFVYIVGSLGGALLVPMWVAIDPALQADLNVLLESIGRIIIFFSPPYGALCALFMTRYFRYVISDEGITVHYLTGRNRKLLWNEVTSLDPICIGNLRYMRFTMSTSKMVVWLPLFVRSEQHLDELIARILPKGHPARAVAESAAASPSSNYPPVPAWAADPPSRPPIPTTAGDDS